MRNFARYLAGPVSKALLLLGLGIALPGQAAILPDTIGYEGYLRNAGAPVDTPQNLTFRIYDQESGGAALWTESHDAVQVTNGVFQVRLGSIVPGSLSDSVTFDRPLFLSVQVGSDAEMSPRLALNLSPYSFAGKILESTVTVDCENGSIADVLRDAADAFQLTIDISGDCVGNLQIGRDKVIIQSSDGTGIITGVAGLENPANAVVHVHGAQGVTLDNVEVVGDPSDPGDASTGMNGIVLADTGQLTVRNGSVVRDHKRSGILVVETSSLDVWGSTVQNNGSYGINVYAGSHADVEPAKNESALPSVVQNNGDSGISVALGSSLDVRGSTIQDNAGHGIAASWSSSVRVRNSSTVQRNGTPAIDKGFDAGVSLNEGSSGRIEDSTITTEMPNANEGAAILVYRGSTLRLRGENTISAPAPPTGECPPSCSSSNGGMAMDVEVDSSVRQDGGKSIITGSVNTYNLATVHLRNIEMTGLKFQAGSLDANIGLRDQSPDDGTATLNGTLVISGSGEVSINGTGSSERAIVNGNVYCSSRDASVPGHVVFEDPANQGYINCKNVGVDLALEIVGPVSDPVQGSVANYTVTVTNLHPAGSAKVEVLDVNFNFSADNSGGFSNNVGITGINDPGGACNFDGFNVNCFTSSIASGGAYTFDIIVDLPDFGIGNFSVNGNAWSGNWDTNGSDNNASFSTNVVEPPL